ncbi:DUF1016 family protein [Candidatus Kaiserbacteria bacterium]|nr:DUF1016 family protein [Candidatus Kaiserbacteria bacterium]
MTTLEVKQHFDEFLRGYDVVGKDAVWAEHSAAFRNFWENRVMKKGGAVISDGEADPIIAILDKNAKGNNRNSEAVAKAMVAQGAWRRMFNDLHVTESICTALNNILTAKDDQSRSAAIDQLFSANEGRKNNLTGPSGNAINAMLAAYNPELNLSIISVGDRTKLLAALSVTLPSDFTTTTHGQRMVTSHSLILNYFRQTGITESARTISVFLYSPIFKTLWRGEVVPVVDEVEEPESEPAGEITGSKATFYMEKELENFLIKNWENTTLGRDLSLIDEDDKFSQQYPTDIGRIDILATDKKTGQYVVIELKKDKTSDDVAGQIARYMGWVQKNKANGAVVRGIIIASESDAKLTYALTQMPNTEILLYKVDFTLEKES